MPARSKVRRRQTRVCFPVCSCKCPPSIPMLYECSETGGITAEFRKCYIQNKAYGDVNQEICLQNEVECGINICETREPIKIIVTNFF